MHLLPAMGHAPESAVQETNNGGMRLGGKIEIASLSIMRAIRLAMSQL
jgi:hypothetical protein